MTLKLEVGTSYILGDGTIHTITGRTGEIFTDGHFQWLENGTFLSCYEGGIADYDLIEEAKPGKASSKRPIDSDHYEWVVSCTNTRDQHPIDFEDYQIAAGIILDLQKQIKDLTDKMN